MAPPPRPPSGTPEPAPGEPDDVLVARTAAGDRGAFEALYRRHAPAVMSFAYHLTFDRAIAEDAVQEAFLRVWRFAGGFRPGNAFRPWLLRIARNLVFERGAAWRRARAPGGAPDPAVPAPAEASGEPGDREALRSALREALLGLSPPLREAFVLVRLSGRSYAEAAEALDVPEGTVKSRMAAAEEALRARLGRFL